MDKTVVANGRISACLDRHHHSSLTHVTEQLPGERVEEYNRVIAKDSETHHFALCVIPPMLKPASKSSRDCS